MGSPNCRIVEIETNRWDGVAYNSPEPSREMSGRAEAARSKSMSVSFSAGPDTASTLSGRSQMVKLLGMYALIYVIRILGFVSQKTITALFSIMISMHADSFKGINEISVSDT